MPPRDAPGNGPSRFGRRRGVVCLADTTIAGRRRARPPSSLLRPASPDSSPLPGGRSGGGSRADVATFPPTTIHDRWRTGRAIAFGNLAAARRHRCHRAGSAASVFSPPPFRGEVGRGVPPLGAPAFRRPRAKRERGCGPPARQAGRTPALPGSSRMSGVGKVSVRAAEPLGQPPSRPPPFQGGEEKTQGGREDPGGRREDGAARLPVRPSRVFPNGGPSLLPPAQGGSEDGPSNAIALGGSGHAVDGGALPA